MPENPPDISVVIPVYNQGSYLQEAVNSALNQEGVRTEVIVVDDGSGDMSEAVAASFGGAIRYLYQPHTGLSAARNRGVAAARGGWLAFLDADDIWTSDKLTKQVQVLMENPHVSMAFSHVRQFHSPELTQEQKDGLAGHDKVLSGHAAGTLLIRKTAFLQVGLFNMQLQVGEFIDWYAKAREAGLTELVLPEVMLHRRLHGNNMSARLKQHRQDYLHVLKASLDRRRSGQ